MWNKIKTFDAYPKMADELQTKTFSGAVVSIFAGFLIFYLFYMELTYFTTLEQVEHLIVDLTRNEKLQINFDVRFPEIPCCLLSIDTTDATGTHQANLIHSVRKTPISKDGTPVGEATKHNMGSAMKKNDMRIRSVGMYQVINSGFCDETPACGEILNSTECQDAFRTLGISTNGSITEAIFTKYNGHNRPNKCFYDTTAELVYWNIRLTPSPATSKYQKICHCAVSPSEQKKKKSKLHSNIGILKNCGSCYGAQKKKNQCCNTCDEVKKAFKEKGWNPPDEKEIEQCLQTHQIKHELLQQLEQGEGCRMYGYISVKKLAGKFHFSPGKSFQHAHKHVHDLAAFQAGDFNVTHIINQLSFGRRFPGIINPLDNTVKIDSGRSQNLEHESVKIYNIEDLISFDGEDIPAGPAGGKFIYYIKIVPTTYVYINGMTQKTNQFSVTEHFKTITHQNLELPGVYFNYEISPIMVKVTETRRSFAHFLTQLCAIVGGAFTVLGMVDQTIYKVIKIIKKQVRPKNDAFHYS